jgi:hypothetical protein
MVKKLKIIAKKVAKKTTFLVKKTGKQAGQVIKSAKKEWKREKPRRDEYTGELKVAIKELFKNGVRVGGDVIKTIKKDIGEINNN